MEQKGSFLLSVKLKTPIYITYPPGLEWLDGDIVDRDWILGYFSTFSLAETFKEKILKRISTINHTFKEHVSDSDNFYIQETFTLDQLMTFNITSITDRSQILKWKYFIDDCYPLIT